MEAHSKGSFIVAVYNHALAIKDGELLDWDKNKFQPTRKVLAAYQIMPEKTEPTQLSLF
jgi:hypothetical protein